MLKVHDVQVFYGRLHALKGISLEISKSQIITLLGANGAGKSTLLAAISGLVAIAVGKIELENRVLNGLSPEQIVRLGISHVPERRELFPEMTVIENLEMGAYFRRDRKDIQKDQELVYSYFPILRKRQSQLALTLSGGEQQMLAIGRALMARPRLLLLDEPSLGLGPLVVEKIFEIIEQINREEGTTILLVEQNTRVALSVASYGYVLETGKIVAAGFSDELLDSDLIKKSYLGLATRL